MKLLEKSTTIDNLQVLSFSLDKSNWYLLSVSARVKSAKQRDKEATDDEDLRIEIDGRKFPKLDDPQRYFDSPAAFSGGKLRNNLQIVYFLIHLESGDHTLSLIPDNQALVENVEINPLDNFPDIHLELNQRAERANGRPWMTLVLVDVSLKLFTVSATVNWHFWDGDDLKIIVDGKVKENPSSFFHRDWIFSASPLRKIGGKEEVEEKTFEENLPKQDFHYIEIWADENPTLHNVKFELEPSIEIKPETQVYKKGPRGEDYNRFDEDIKNAVRDWNETFLAQKYPPSESLDPNLVKAMIYVESRMGYGVSSTDYPAYPDLMQVADPRNPAIHTLNNDGWVDPNTEKVAQEYEWEEGKGVAVLDYHGEATGNTSQESIKWGTRWLYHKAQFITNDGKRDWRSWNQAVQNYNAEGNVKYEKEVYDVYERGIDRREGHLIRLWSLILLTITTIILSEVIWTARTADRQDGTSQVLSASAPSKTQSEVINEVKGLMEKKLDIYETKKLYYYGDLFREPVDFCAQYNQCYPDLIFPEYVSELANKMQTNEQFTQAAAALGIINRNNFYHGDIDNDGRTELVFVIPDYLNREYTTLFVIDQVGGSFQLYKKKVGLGYFSTSNSKIGYQNPLEVTDLTGDTVPEILLFLSGGRWGASLYIFGYSQGEINNLFNIDGPYIYPELIFTDQNHNRTPEIQVTGEKFGLIPFNFECNACQHMKVEEVFEYNPARKSFEQIRQKYLGISGAFYHFLEEVRRLGFNHYAFRNWTSEEKRRFTYLLDQLYTKGPNSLFDTANQPYVSEEEKKEVVLQLRRPIKLEDIVVREDETNYYHQSPTYGVKFIRTDNEWRVDYFIEIEKGED